MHSKRAAIIVVALLVAIHLTILLAGFVAPYDSNTQDREFSYAPPTRIHFAHAFPFRPFVYALTPEFDSYQEDRTQTFPIHFFVRGDEYRLLGIFRCRVHLFGVDAPARLLLLGTDLYGRDEFSRLVYGGQISLAAGLLATLITLGIATVVGGVSGYCGRWVDESLMGCSELFLSLPWFYFLVGVRAVLPLRLSPASTFLLLISVIGILGWARPSRLIRGIALSVRNRNYVLAARSFGASDLYLLRRHVLPEMLGVLLTQAAVLLPQYIAAEATLSFFGLGIGEPIPSWGNMLSTLAQYNVLVSYYWMLAPAAALVVTSVMYWVLAEALHHWLQFHSI